MNRKPVSAVVVEELGGGPALVVVCDDGSTWTLDLFVENAEYEQIESIPGTPAYEESSN